MRAFGRALAEWALERNIEHDIAGVSLRTSWLQQSEPGVPGRALASPSELLLLPPSQRVPSSDGLGTARASTGNAVPVVTTGTSLPIATVGKPVPDVVVNASRTEPANVPALEAAKTYAGPT